MNAPQTYRLHTPNSPSSPKICRDTVALLLRVTGHPELVDTAGLLVSELVTNVSLHTASLAVSLEAVVRRDRVRVSVYDDSPAGSPPVPSMPDQDSDSGRGLLLVQAMAQAWGVGPGYPSGLDRRDDQDGKHVWFELRDHPAHT